MKILMSAYSCLPGRGSEPGTGWAWAQAATQDHEVWLLTHTANAKFIEAQRSADPELAARLHPVYLHIGHRFERLRRLGPLRMVYYILWQAALCPRAARRLHDEVGFDVAHHVTFASDNMPAGVGWVPGLPFVWGPVGGASTIVSPRLLFQLGPTGFITELIRLAVLVPLRLVVGGMLARRASLVVGQNPDVARAFSKVKVVVQPHIALDRAEFSPRQEPANQPPVAVFAGRMLAWKGLRLAIAALRCPEASSWRLHLYGDGPDRQRLERLAGRWGVIDRVQFFGQRPRSEVQSALARADVMIFPPLRGSISWAVAESIAVGCPVVALRTGGTVAVVGPTDGVLIEPSGSVAREFAAALDRARTLRPAGERWRGADPLPDILADLYRRAISVGSELDAPRAS